MTTYIEIIDTAVKIGLGAVVSGVATYWVAKLNHDKDIEKDQLRRRAQLIEDIAKNIGQFTETVSTYLAKLTEWVHYEKLGKGKTLRDELKEMEKVVSAAP